MLNQCHFGDCRESLQRFADAGIRVQTCVTSPPYWGLRDYGVEGQLGMESRHDCMGWATGDACGECYVCHLVAVFRLVRGVLASDGTVWLNLGDSYISRGGMSPQSGKLFKGRARQRESICISNRKNDVGLAYKNLSLVPARVALALQADGWIVRSDVIWAKKNCMPESVTDRPSRSHEYVYLLAKSSRYYYDANAIREPAAESTHQRLSQNNGQPTWNGNRQRGYPGQAQSMDINKMLHSKGRNRRDVWHVATQPFPDAHFATFPPALIEPCILAGSKGGDCVLDPFLGSGTTAEVAERLGRQWLGCELNPSYESLQRERLRQASLAL